MLKSLFGDLESSFSVDERPALPTPLDSHADGPSARADSQDNSVALVTRQKTKVQKLVHTTQHLEARSDGRLLNRVDQDLYLHGSPIAAMRRHLANTLPAEGSRLITLLDPAQRWAGDLIRALSDATGEPIQRVNVRDHATHRIMASVERTVIPRRGDSTLKLYRADLQNAASNDALPQDSLGTTLALMECSDMACVVLPVTPPASCDHTPRVDLLALNRLLGNLSQAVHAASWRCPALVFVMPIVDLEAAQRIRAVHWPVGLQIDHLDDTQVAASQRWNAILSAWDRHDLTLLTTPTPANLEAIEEARAIGRQLRQLMGTSGLMGAAVADVGTGQLIAGESHRADIDLAHASQVLAPLVRAHVQAFDELGRQASLEEFVTVAGQVQFVVRPLAAKRPGNGLWFMFAQLDRAHANLSLARLKVAEAQRNLG
jgi:hypothetical protein